MSAARRLAPAALLLAAGLALAPGSTAGPTIDGLRVERADERLLVSFDVEGAFSERALERLAAGLPLVFRHRVELVDRRSVPLWFPKVLARASVTNRAEYDSLTRRYRLSRLIAIERVGGSSPPTEGERLESTESLDEVRAFMSRVRELPVVDLIGLDRVEGLRVRVESSVGRRYALLFIPTAVRATAATGIGP